MGKKMSTDQFAEFVSAVVRALPRTMDTTVAQGWILNQDALANVLAEALLPPNPAQTPAFIDKALDTVSDRVTLSPHQFYFTPIPDANVPERNKPTLAKYRQLATEHGVPATTAVCYRVRAGFTLKQHAPKSGPCYGNFAYLQDWNFPDEPIGDSLVFWVPRILRGSTSKTKDEQVLFLTDTRTRLDLPSHHLTGFGKVALIAGLILAHFKATGERTPLDCYWVRTDTCRAGGHRLSLGLFDGIGLYCDDWSFDVSSDVSLGAFALGVEALGT